MENNKSKVKVNNKEVDAAAKTESETEPKVSKQSSGHKTLSKAAGDGVKSNSLAAKPKTAKGVKEKTASRETEPQPNPSYERIEKEFDIKFAEFFKNDYMLKVKEKQIVKAKGIFDKFKEEGKEDGEAFISTMKQFSNLNEILSDVSNISVEPKDEYYIKQINRRALCTQLILWLLFFVIYISVSLSIGNWFMPLLGILVCMAVSVIIQSYFRVKKSQRRPNRKKKK